MGSPLQGIGQKLAKLRHDAELDASKIGERVDTISARKDAAVSKVHTGLDGQERDIADIEQFVVDMEKATNV